MMHCVAYSISVMYYDVCMLLMVNSYLTMVQHSVNDSIMVMDEVNCHVNRVKIDDGVNYHASLLM